MTVVAAFLVPGSPLPLLKSDNLPWGRIAAGYERAGRALAAVQPDVLLVYSTQWIAVLDQLWQTSRQLSGVHVDENWYEYGELKYDLRVDTELAYSCIASSGRLGIHSRAVNYDGFPIDSGTIVATHYLLNGKSIPVTLTSNNLYHDGATTEKLAQMAVAAANEQGKRIAVVGVGNLSGSTFREEIDIRADRIATEADDAWNRKILDLLERGDVDGLRAQVPKFADEARADMGFKHFYWLLGAVGGRFYGARTHAYGPVYGNGAAVVELRL